MASPLNSEQPYLRLESVGTVDDSKAFTPECMPVYSQRIARVEHALDLRLKENEFYMHYNGEAPLQEAERFFGSHGDVERYMLDIGCGFGGTVRYFARKDHFRKVVGIDIQQRMIHLAEELLLKHDLDLRCKCIYAWADIAEVSPETIYEWTGSKVDAVTSLNVFIHLDKVRLLRTFRLIDQVLLSPGGKVYIEDFCSLRTLTSAEQEILSSTVACPYLPTAAEYLQVIRETNPGWQIQFEDISAGYTRFARTRLLRSLDSSKVGPIEQKFYQAMNGMLSSGAIGGVRVKIESKLPA